MTLKEITEPFVNTLANYKNERDKIDAKIELRKQQINRLETKQNKLIMPYWVDEIMKPLADQIMKSYEGFEYDLSGPFGICSKIHLCIQKNESIHRYIIFQPGNIEWGELYIVNHAVNTGKFPQGSIGALNGMNNPSTEIPIDSTIEQIVEMIEEINKEE